MSDATVTLVDGAGGAASRRLVAEHVVPRLAVDPDHPDRPLLDATPFTAPGTRLATTTDAHVVRPLEFPGGSIGSLAVHGTVNDLAMCGAQPLALSSALILEEGLPMDDLWRVVRSMQQAAAAVGVPIVTGDTKVVEAGAVAVAIAPRSSANDQPFAGKAKPMTKVTRIPAKTDSRIVIKKTFLPVALRVPIEK